MDSARILCLFVSLAGRVTLCHTKARQAHARQAHVTPGRMLHAVACVVRGVSSGLRAGGGATRAPPHAPGSHMRVRPSLANLHAPPRTLDHTWCTKRPAISSLSSRALPGPSFPWLHLRARVVVRAARKPRARRLCLQPHHVASHQVHPGSAEDYGACGDDEKAIQTAGARLDATFDG